MVILDEAWVYTSYCNGKRRIFYASKNKNIPTNLVYEKHEKFDNKFIVAGALTGRLQPPLIKVHPNVKIHSEYYIENVLKPLLET